MTAVDDRPVNGHAARGATVPVATLGAELVPAGETAVGTAPGPSTRITALEQRVRERENERALLTQLVEIDADPVFDEIRDDDERDADRKVAKAIRAKARRERKRAGKADVLRARRNRRWSWWDERAERVRDRILDPARAIGADYRKLVVSSVAAFVLIAGGVAYMSVNVHHGLVGVDGSWTAYLVEPLASVLLAISLLAQFTARTRGIPITRGFVWFDVSLAFASLLLNVVPSGMRFGWQNSDFVAHLLVPALVIAAVVAWHLASSLYSTAIALSKSDPITQERLLLLRQALADHRLPADVSPTQVIKYLRAALPNGIGHQEGRRIAKLFLGH